ncbi:MAG TPA: DMT family transporter [Acidobacteriota bacterium]|nr:DMT family transporter [Acidobacteriota bacterium]
MNLTMTRRWREVSGYLLIMLASCFWGGAATLGKMLFREGITTAQLMQIRSVFTAIILFPALAIFSWRHLSIRARDLFGLLLLALPGLVVVNASYYQAVKMMPVAIAVFIQFTAAGLVFLYGWLTKTEKATAAKLFALVLSIVGTFLMVQLQRNQLQDIPAFALFCAFLSMLSYAFYLIVSHRLAEKHSPFTLVAYGYGLAAIFWIIATNPVHTFEFITENKLWTPAVLFSLFSTLIPFTLFMTAMKRITPTGAAIASTTETVMASLFAFMFLGELLLPVQMVGAAFILCAIILLMVPSKFKPEPTEIAH